MTNRSKITFPKEIIDDDFKRIVFVMGTCAMLVQQCGNVKL